MSDGNLTILNPQQIKVTAEVALPGQGVQGKLLRPQEQWVIPNGVTTDQWVAFFDPRNGEILAAASLPAQSTFAQILLEIAISGLLRLNPQEPLTASNGLNEEVVVRLQNVGAPTADLRKLAPRGKPGSSHDFAYHERGQWLGFYETDGTYITGTAANSFSEVNLTGPRQVYVVGDPYPVTPAAAAKEGVVRLTVPMVE